MEFNENTFSDNTPQQQDPAEQIPPVQTAEEAIPEQPAYTRSAEPQPEYRQPEQARKASPFADSPYVMDYDPEPKPRKQKRSGGGRKVVAALLTVVLVLGGCLATGFVVNEVWQDRLEQTQLQFQQQLDALQDQIDSDAPAQQILPGSIVSNTEGALTPAQVYAMNVNTVVQVENYITGNAFGQPVSGMSSGSGVILSEDGYVLTNYHVVEGNGTLSVITSDKQTWEAQLVGYDENNDVALLKMDAQGLQAAVVGSSDALLVGDQVVAIGYPLGGTIASQTVGYISAKSRTVSNSGYAIDMLQTDAAINSGNSGGPLFNMKGEVVGITTSKYSGTTSSGATIEGFGFAIPVDDIKDMLRDLASYGYVKGAYLGVMVSDMDPQNAAYFGVPTGAYINEVMDGFCAKEAGMQAKDIVIALGEYTVTDRNTLTKALRSYKPGDTVTVVVFRGGTEVELTVTLDERPPENTGVPEGLDPEQLDPEQMPESGDFEEWFNYLKPFFGQTPNG